MRKMASAFKLYKIVNRMEAQVNAIHVYKNTNWSIIDVNSLLSFLFAKFIQLRTEDCVPNVSVDILWKTVCVKRVHFLPIVYLGTSRNLRVVTVKKISS